MAVSQPLSALLSQSTPYAPTMSSLDYCQFRPGYTYQHSAIAHASEHIVSLILLNLHVASLVA